jgi:hypothetical protein
MHANTLKKLGLALAFWLAVHMSSLRAQILGPDGTSPTVFEVDAHGLLFDTGTEGTGTLSLSGAGTRMFWYPGKAAFRAGEVDGTQWNDANIGAYSVAFGYDTKASGGGSTALGSQNTVSGDYAMSWGFDNQAAGWGSTASGYYNAAAANGATALGVGNNAIGYAATALGVGNNAIGYAATALGVGNTATGYWSTAFGNNTTASGDYSTASGYLTLAGGNYSAAFGANTHSAAYSSFVIGAFNVGLSSTGATPSATSWVPTDPLFEVGNGGGGDNLGGNPSLSTSSDALVVYKNGNATFQGVVNVAPVPDIPMYEP